MQRKNALTDLQLLAVSFGCPRCSRTSGAVWPSSQAFKDLAFRERRRRDTRNKLICSFVLFLPWIFKVMNLLFFSATTLALCNIECSCCPALGCCCCCLGRRHTSFTTLPLAVVLHNSVTRGVFSECCISQAFFLTSVTEKTKTQAQNSSQKLKEKTQF